MVVRVCHQHFIERLGAVWWLRSVVHCRRRLVRGRGERSRCGGWGAPPLPRAPLRHQGEGRLGLTRLSPHPSIASVTKKLLTKADWGIPLLPPPGHPGRWALGGRCAFVTIGSIRALATRHADTAAAPDPERSSSLWLSADQRFLLGFKWLSWECSPCRRTHSHTKPSAPLVGKGWLGSNSDQLPSCYPLFPSTNEPQPPSNAPWTQLQCSSPVFLLFCC